MSSRGGKEITDGRAGNVPICLTVCLAVAAEDGTGDWGRGMENGRVERSLNLHVSGMCAPLNRYLH